MLALLIRAAPLSGKCSKLEKGVCATLVPVQPVTACSKRAAVRTPVTADSPPSKVRRSSRRIAKKMHTTATCAVAVAQPTNSEDRASTAQLLDETAAVSEHTHANTRASSSDGSDGADSLKWCEARRIRSEPVGLQSRPSVCSLESEAERARAHERADEDDVFEENGFSAGEDEAWSVYPEDESFEEEESWLGCSWEEFTIPAEEINLTTILSRTPEETVFSGYWHGSVQVIAREARTSLDARYFWQEVSALNKIRHESIQLFMGMTLDMDGGRLGLVMSPLKGDSVYTRLHMHGHEFSMPSKFKIVEQICEGMEYLHSRGIAHGRLTSSTVHIHNRVSIQFRPQVRFPRHISSQELASLPPEDMRAAHLHEYCLVLPTPPSLEADVFAFGTLLYELILLEKPFKGVARECVVWRVGSGHLQPLSLVPRDRLRGIIQRCWQLSPEDRPTFKNILTDVEQNVPVFSTQTGGGIQRSLSLPSVLTDPPSPRIIS